jgi:hypothetical protein
MWRFINRWSRWYVQLPLDFERLKRVLTAFFSFNQHSLPSTRIRISIIAVYKHSGKCVKRCDRHTSRDVMICVVRTEHFRYSRYVAIIHYSCVMMQKMWRCDVFSLRAGSLSLRWRSAQVRGVYTKSKNDAWFGIWDLDTGVIETYVMMKQLNMKERSRAFYYTED